jgi:hypothetical protein
MSKRRTGRTRRALAQALIKAKAHGIGIFVVSTDPMIDYCDEVLAGWLAEGWVNDLDPYPDRLRGLSLYKWTFERKSRGHWRLCVAGRWGDLYVVKHGRQGNTKVAVFLDHLVTEPNDG